ncbi:hypothetical protein CSB68_2595 [Acinetobacter baumannii]|nr:hypothetical protein CSB68_2595 [Acinetobacter baumannii]
MSQWWITLNQRKKLKFCCGTGALGGNVIVPNKLRLKNYSELIFP